MGYTHYFECVKPVPATDLPAIIEFVSAIFVEAIKTIPLGNWNGEVKFTQPKDIFQYNGKELVSIDINGFGDDSFETFSLDLKPNGFQCCKTNRRNYDVVVTAVLIAANTLAPGCWDISSDGGTGDWMPGSDLIDKMLDVRLSCPRKIYRDDEE